LLDSTTSREGHSPATGLHLVMLADDLTGACDAAAPFAMRGLRTEVGVARNASPSPLCDIWACSSESRDSDAQLVDQTILRSLNRLPPARVLFKKIDSVLRGNTMVEIAAIRRLRPEGVAVLAPSFPHAGRTVRGGMLEIHDLMGTRTLALLSPLRELGLAVHGIAASNDPCELRREMQTHAASKGSLLLCDAESQEHLEALVNAVDSIAAPLWIGSAGLAHALARRWSGASAEQETKSPASREAVKALLFFIGSTHAATRAQVEAIEHHEATHVQVIQVPRGHSSRELILDTVFGLRAEEIGCLFVTGGDTASVVFAALGITALHVVDEFASGIPHCIAIGGRFEGVPVLLKSGGFGRSSLLCEVAENFSAVQQQVGRSSL